MVIYKIISLGNTGTGKTCIFNRFSKNIYNEYIPLTFGVDFMICNMTINSQEYKLQMWDLAGIEKFRNIVRSYYRNTHGAILVYDITDSESLLSLEKWLNDLSFSYNLHNFLDSPALVMVGTKKDIKKKQIVSFDEAKKFAQLHGIKDVIECSAKTGENISKIFEVLTLRINEKVDAGYMSINGMENLTLLDLETQDDKLTKMAKCCSII